ncbi:ABC transporter substrate-binding protein [Streptomyces sp. NPDC001508]|uniref:ABC transporter substrate-binding protein n=1 Tax=Streptomyces sp. NPDC001508 TaxID=3154656 RepID=UPI003320318A
MYQNSRARTSRRQFLQLAVMVGVTASGVSACSAGTSKQGGGTLRVAFGGTRGGAFNLDPAGPNRLYEALSALYGYVVVLDEKHQPHPDLVTDWSVSKDATQWSFKVRSNVEFHDGHPLTSSDIAYTLKRVLDPETGSAGASLLAPSLTPSGISTPDTRTLRLDLKAPNSNLAATLASYQFGIIREGTGTDIAKTGIGTGPFRLKEFPPGGTVVLSRSDSYRKGPARLDELHFTPIADAGARVNALLAGQVELLYSDSLAPADLARVAADPECRVVRAPSGTWDVIVMNCAAKPFSDVRVRQAFKAVVDQKQILDVVLSGKGGVADNNPVALGDPLRASTPSIRDIPKAKRLLAEAGYPNGIDVTLHVAPYTETFLPLAQAYQQQAAEAGIRVKLQQHSADNYVAETFGKADFYVDYWGPRPAAQALNEVFLTGSANNETHWSNSTFDDALSQARATTDIARQKTLYAQAQRTLADDGGAIIPVFEDISRAARKNVANFPGKNQPDARPDYHTLGLA